MATPPRRADFGHALVHLTRERTDISNFETVKSEQKAAPFDVLKEILVSGVIRGSGNGGYIKGNRRAVCFSEIPLASMHQFATPMPESGRYRFTDRAQQTNRFRGWRSACDLPARCRGRIDSARRKVAACSV